MARDAAHHSGARVMHHAAQRSVYFRVNFGRRNARQERGRRQESCLIHSQRLEDLLARVVVEHLAADAVHDLAEQNEVCVAIDEARAGGNDGHFLHRALYARLVAAEFRFGVEVGPEAGIVGE